MMPMGYIPSLRVRGRGEAAVILEKIDPERGKRGDILRFKPEKPGKSLAGPEPTVGIEPELEPHPVDRVRHRFHPGREVSAGNELAGDVVTEPTHPRVIDVDVEEPGVPAALNRGSYRMPGYQAVEWVRRWGRAGRVAEGVRTWRKVGTLARSRPSTRIHS